MRSLILFTFLFTTISVIAQTGIGTTTPEASAKLDVNATNKGFLPPRVTLTSTTDNTTIPNPATGLLIYNTGNNAGLASGYYYWNGGTWATIATAGGSGTVAASFMRGSKNAIQSLSVDDKVSFSQIDASSGSNISLNTTTGQITLSAGFTYKLIASIPGFSGSRPNFKWYNETAGSYFGSSLSGYTPSDGAGNGAFGGISEAIFTPNVNTVVSYRMSSATSSTVTAGGNTDFTVAGSYPWFEIQVISGNTPMSVINYGDVKTGFQTGDHNGWIKLDGRAKSTLSSSQQAQATALGIGANLPDATNAFLVQNGGTIGNVSGSSAKTIDQANLPNVTLGGTAASSGAHTHTISFSSSTPLNGAWAVSQTGVAGYNLVANETTSSSGAHTHTITTNSINGGVTQTTLDITPKSLTVNTFIYLGY